MTLALGCVDHVKGFGAELLPLLALGLAGRLVAGGDDHSLDGLSEVLSLESSDLGGGADSVDAGHCSVFWVPGLPAVPILYTIGSRWQPCSVHAYPRTLASAFVQRVEITKDQIAQSISPVLDTG